MGTRGADVVVAGAGVAASATAIRLVALGLDVRLLVRDLPVAPGIEALPRRTLDLFDELSASSLLAEVGAVEVPGPAHEWHGEPGRVPSPAVHVDRTALAAGLRSVAVSRGVTIERVRHLPDVADLPDNLLAAVDGTGRAAAWSRPVRTHGHAVAWQFRAPAGGDMAGIVVRDGHWWAYRLGHPTQTWVGIVTQGATLDHGIIATAASRLGLSATSLVPQGRRPAWVQGAVDPVVYPRIAVGDAALAHDPIAGQGIRFSLGSALAAATTVTTWAEGPSRRDLAAAYYRDLVRDEEARHLAHLQRLAHEQNSPLPRTALPAVVQFATEVVETALSVDGRVEAGKAVRLPNGRTARWLGTFDLLELAQIAAEPTPRLLVVTRLQDLALDAPAARAIVSWALSNGVLTAPVS